MSSGESAAAESARAQRAADRLRRKADWAQQVANNYAKGAIGETIVAESLSSLERAGWRCLHDRRHPNGGNIDHIAIGPPGIAVLDAKHWTAPVTITDDRRLVASKYDHTEVVEKLDQTIQIVRGMLQADGVRVAVRGCIVLTGDADRSREVRDLGDVRILGVEGLPRELTRSRGDLNEGLIEALQQTLAVRLPAATDPRPPPPSGAAVATGPAAPSPAFQKAQRFYYLRPWRRAGHNRLYLRDADGTTLGWTDVNTGACSIECKGDDEKLVEALLKSAAPTGVKLSSEDLPKVAWRLRGGRLLSRIARLHTSVLVGQEWKNYGKHRLYGTLIDPGEATWDLGYVDLKSGEIHPASEGDLSSLRGPARRYLEYLHYKMPAPSASKAP